MKLNTKIIIYAVLFGVVMWLVSTGVLYIVSSMAPPAPHSHIQDNTDFVTQSQITHLEEKVKALECEVKGGEYGYIVLGSTFLRYEVCTKDGKDYEYLDGEWVYQSNEVLSS